MKKRTLKEKYYQKYKLNIEKYFCLLLLFSGCISPRIMETAKPLEKREVSAAVGVSGYANDEIVFGGMELNVRYGIGHNSDVGLSTNLPVPGHLRLDYKKQLLTTRSNSLYLSSGLSVEGFIPDEYSSMISAFSIPLFFSFNHNNKVVPYLAQRYTMSFSGWNSYRYHEDKLPLHEKANFKNTILYSGGLGFAFGEKHNMWFIEFTFFSNHTFFLKNYYSETSNEWVYDKGQHHENTGIQISFGKKLFVKSAKQKVNL